MTKRQSRLLQSSNLGRASCGKQHVQQVQSHRPACCGLQTLLSTRRSYAVTKFRYCISCPLQKTSPVPCNQHLKSPFTVQLETFRCLIIAQGKHDMQWVFAAALLHVPTVVPALTHGSQSADTCGQSSSTCQLTGCALLSASLKLDACNRSPQALTLE